MKLVPQNLFPEPQLELYLDFQGKSVLLVANRPDLAVGQNLAKFYILDGVLVMDKLSLAPKTAAAMGISVDDNNVIASFL